MKAAQKVRRPFHETIVDAINGASSMEEFVCLAPIIKMTKIPKGHDEIIAAWKKQTTDFFGSRDLGVLADLLEQKQEAGEEEATKKAAEEG